MVTYLFYLWHHTVPYFWVISPVNRSSISMSYQDTIHVSPYDSPSSPSLLLPLCHIDIDGKIKGEENTDPFIAAS